MGDDLDRPLKKRKLARPTTSFETDSDLDAGPSVKSENGPVLPQDFVEPPTENTAEDTASAFNSDIGGSNAEQNEHTLPLLSSLGRKITPPARTKPRQDSMRIETHQYADMPKTSPLEDGKKSKCKVLPSPFQLTHIRDLPQSHNIDCIRLSDVLGDPLIKECWQFNYLFDLNFLMDAFDEDIKNLVQVKIVHGSWKKEDPHRLRIEEESKSYPNLQLVSAYMPEAFGTHHSKMMILFRHDDTAQVIIHTSNMIPFDWTNMTQALFRTPLLPLSAVPDSKYGQDSLPAYGTGARFKIDLLKYLSAYQGRTRALRDELIKYDFSAVVAALVASVPSRLSKTPSALNSGRWGWLGLTDVLKTVPGRVNNLGERASIIVQISSIATLTPAWIDSFFSKLSITAHLLDKAFDKAPEPKFKVIFPTADEIRRSLNGYRSGTSIHIKIQSPAQQKQVDYLHPYLCHWANDALSSAYNERSSEEQSGLHVPMREAYRRRAAPHIKTYIRYSSAALDQVDWVLLTSANLSQQAWGAGMASKDSEVRICSYEIGVCFWPALYNGGAGENVRMVPAFGKDIPEVDSRDGFEGTTIGVRVPYDLPLKPYGKGELPWCATAAYSEPDWMGVVVKE